MFVRIIIVLCFAVCAIAGYTGAPGFHVQEASAAALNPAEVHAAWDEVCGYFNFDECPADVLNGSSVLSMEDLYLGSLYSVDCEALMEAIKIEVDAIANPDPPNIDDLVSAVLEDPIWQE